MTENLENSFRIEKSSNNIILLCVNVTDYCD